MSSNPSDKLSSSRLAKRREAFEGLVLLTAIVALMWFLEVINSIDHDGLDHAAGIVPRDAGHVWAIFPVLLQHCPVRLSFFASFDVRNEINSS